MATPKPPTSPESGDFLSEPSAQDQSVVLDATLALSQTQLLAQISDETSLDGRTMGVLGFNGALLAADIAAKDLLGRWWWSPLPFVVVATVLCLRSIFSQDTFLGPEALRFYATFGGQSAVEGRKQLLADLDVAFRANSSRARKKTTALRSALGILVAGLVIAALLIVFDRPSKVVADVHCSIHPSSSVRSDCANRAKAGAGTRTLGSAPGRAARHQKITVSSRLVVS